MAHDHHAHDHSGHGHGGHGHDHTHGASERSIGIAAALTGVFMIAELAGGLVSGSLALIADAGHMFIDFASLAFAFIAFRMTRRPADALRTYGYDRLQVLVAFANGLILFPVAGWIIWEAVERLQSPAPVLGGLMLWVAVGGLLVNIAAFFVLHGADKDNVNIRGALLHVLGDMLGSVGAIAAALIIMLTGWTPIDPILSVVVSVIILGGAWRLVRDSGSILLEAAPASLNTGEIGQAIVGDVPQVTEVHHVHLWSITEKRRMATLHACLVPGSDPVTSTRAIKQVLTERFGIGHATVEIGYGACEAQHVCASPAASEQVQRPEHSHEAGGCGHSHDHGHGHAHRWLPA
jgi:cobalt-zinc-cadmium efflux system protein